MKLLFLLTVVVTVLSNLAAGRSQIQNHLCVNVWDEGCANGQLPGSGGDDDYLNGGFNPGKRCINLWDEGCANNQLPGSGGDDDYLNGGFNPGKRSSYPWFNKFKTHQN